MAVSNFYPYSLYAACRVVVVAGPVISFSGVNVASVSILATGRTLVNLVEGIEIGDFLAELTPEAQAVGAVQFNGQIVLDPTVTVVTQVVVEIFDEAILAETFVYHLGIWRKGLL